MGPRKKKFQIPARAGRVKISLESVGLACGEQRRGGRGWGVPRGAGLLGWSYLGGGLVGAAFSAAQSRPVGVTDVSIFLLRGKGWMGQCEAIDRERSPQPPANGGREHGSLHGCRVLGHRFTGTTGQITGFGIWGWQGGLWVDGGRMVS